jgi:hypothetical protein
MANIPNTHDDEFSARHICAESRRAPVLVSITGFIASESHSCRHRDVSPSFGFVSSLHMAGERVCADGGIDSW